jgi:hypothetical protein
MSNSTDNYRNDACKTYLEQTKLLTTLSSAFIIAPVALFEKFQNMNLLVILMEVFFIFSIFTGYVVFGTIAGTQHKGDCNVHNKGTTIFSWIQIVFFFLGITFLLINLSIDSDKSKQEGIKPNIPTNSEVQTIKIKKTIFFDLDKTEIRPESFEKINSSIENLKNNQNHIIEISANTDSIGTELYNLKLSKQRALEIKNYLISNGIKPERIIIKYWGEINPITSNSTYNGRVLNRRVELLLMDKNQQ